VLLTRERIQETLDEAAERGKVTRSDANELAAELWRRGRQQTDDLLSNIEQLLGRGRQQLESATRRARDPVARLVRGGERENSTEKSEQAFPILNYEEMTAAQVEGNLDGLTPAELRTIRNYERGHANRKSVLAAIERALP
jgi:polyhydroxyalkanoate synthesis regulator phasin